MINRKQKGYSIIELMVVVAIIGILAAVAIPTYSNYVYRGYLVKAIALTGNYQSMVNDYLLSNGGNLDCSGMNADNPNWVYFDLSDPSPSVWDIGIHADCSIEAALKNFIANGGAVGVAVVYTPTISADKGVVTWACNIVGDGTYGPLWAPSSCPYYVPSS